MQSQIVRDILYYELLVMLLHEMSKKCTNFMYTRNVQKCGISVHLLGISEYLKLRALENVATRAAVL